ncbi:MAG: BamA/TamA family outer membrane protein [Chitinophagales bacterium]|nr:BamA/TamA family outer membrane protein [Chitinophagales bacterium]
MHRLLLFFISSILLTGCAGTKRLPPGEVFVEKVQVRLMNPEMVNKKSKVKDALSSKAAPKLNSKFLGLFRTKLWLYTHVKEPKKEKGLRHWLKYKRGEAPSYFYADECERAALTMEKYLEDNGYFRARVKMDTVMRKKNAQVIYSVTVNGQYFVRNILLPAGDDEVSRIIKDNKRKLLIRTGDAYSMDMLKAQRETFATLVRSEGYYDFNREYIYYYVDSTIGNRKLDIYFRLKEPSDSTQHIKYFISHVTIYPTYSIDDTVTRARYDTLSGEGYTIIQPEVFLKQRALLTNIRLRQGETFSQRNHANTVNRFLDMGIFKYVNIRYEKKGDSLDVIMQLTPANTQDITGEVNLNTATGNFLGVGASVGYMHHNLFKGGEMLNISASANLELQINSGSTLINTMEVTARAELGFPRFMLLFKKNYKFDLPYVPRTNLGITETYQRRIEYYTINSIITDFGYDWRKNEKVRHIFTPFSVNNIRMFSITSDFEDILAENPVLKSSFEDVLIVGNAYSLVYTGSQKGTDRSYGYLRPNIENAGNFLYFVNSKTKPDEEKPYTIYSRPYASYIKVDGDARYFLKLTRKQSLAARIIAGIAVPMGNSEVIPYMKQFFIGGSTSVRAWRLRALGPGSYSNPYAAQLDYFPDQTGDIKLEMNLEYRFTIVKFFKGALFADAGNIWLLNEDPQRPGGEFEASRFYKEIAIGSGVGVRLDFDFLVIRTDVSMPLRKPSLPEGDRWTFDKLYFSNKDWRRENVIWNIAIGYPF